MFLEKMRLDGRVAVVTGGGRGIGLACGEALCEAGARLIIADIDPDVAEDGRRQLADKGYAAEVVTLAGVARTGVAAVEVSDEHWLAVNDINYNGVFWCNRAFGRHMLARRSGSIVNIGSMSGFIVNRPQKQAYYNASKAAVHHMTKSLATEWADRGVRVNAVAPTYIETPMTVFADPAMIEMWLRDTPMGRMGQPEEIASVVHFLACDASSLLTGAIINADAGFTCW